VRPVTRRRRTYPIRIGELRFIGQAITLRPMVDWIQAYVLRVSRVLEHRLASFLGTAVMLLLLGDSIRRVLPEDEQGGVLMWIWIGLGAYGGIATVYWVQRGPESGGLFIAWFIAITPALGGTPRRD
jgi:hypothetical protein